jgi:predicted nucleotidyltransferase
MTREERAARIRVELEAQLKALLPAGARAWLIGSLAWGGFGAYSDVDLVVSGVDALETAELQQPLQKL